MVGKSIKTTSIRTVKQGSRRSGTMVDIPEFSSESVRIFFWDYDFYKNHFRAPSCIFIRFDMVKHGFQCVSLVDYFGPFCICVDIVSFFFRMSWI